MAESGQSFARQAGPKKAGLPGGFRSMGLQKLDQPLATGGFLSNAGLK